jgi:hypothetical protein
MGNAADRKPVDPLKIVVIVAAVVLAIGIPAIVIINVLIPAGVFAESRSAQRSSATATPSPTTRWIQSDEFDTCTDLYASVPGSSANPSSTCQLMLDDNDVETLIAAFADADEVDLMRADLEAQVAALAAPAPTQAAPAPTPATHVISDQARHVLDTNMGAGFSSSPAIKDQYCTFSNEMLENAAEVAVEMYRDITTADVVAYVNEVCGR